MKRHPITATTILLLALGCATLAAVATGQTQRKHPNILWIVGENLKLDLGCYGANNVKTPNLDGLAANGVRYTHAFSTSPVCAPSRSAFFAGMYQTTSDTHNMRSHREDGYKQVGGSQRSPAVLRPDQHAGGRVRHLRPPDMAPTTRGMEGRTDPRTDRHRRECHPAALVPGPPARAQGMGPLPQLGLRHGPDNRTHPPTTQEGRARR